MTTSIPAHAQVVIIGGGVIGTAVAFHLSALGCTDVIVLERGQLGCGTSWHAAGNIAMMDHCDDVVKLNRLAGDLYESFEHEQPIGWRRCGRVMFARTAERMNEFKQLVAVAAKVGVEAHIITPKEAGERMPLFRTDDLIGALWSPHDGRVNPTDLIATYARKARQKGIRIVEGVAVESVATERSAVKSVNTAAGPIRCESIVNCTGLWSRLLGLTNGIDIPIYAVEHFYALTEAIDGVTPDMPTFRDPDGLIYGREEVGGLLVGCFDREAKPISAATLPANFFFQLLNEDWDQFGPYMKEGIHRIPVLADTGIRTLLNGPEGFTPDAHPILDKTSIEGYFVLAGLCSGGIIRSAGLGQAMARWVVDGDPGMDVSPYSLSRFSRQHNEEAWLRERIRHVPSGYLSTAH